MMQTNGKQFRGLALLTGSVLAASALFHPAAARDRDSRYYPPTQEKEKDNSTAYKTGAAVLGAASVYMILKGKTLPGVAAAAGAYLAYKEGRKDDRDANQYPQYPSHPGYNQPSSYPNSYPNNSYPNNYPSNGYPTYSNNYPPSSYPAYNSPTNYPSGGYGGQNSNCQSGSGYNTGQHGTYNGGYNQYPNSYRAVAPQSAAPAPTNTYRDRDNRERNRDYVLR